MPSHGSCLLLLQFAGYLVITEAANAIGRYQVKSELLLAGMHVSGYHMLLLRQIMVSMHCYTNTCNILIR